MYMNMYLLFLNFSECVVVGLHEYPPSSYKHVHEVGGEDGDQIMKSGSGRI